MRNYSQIKAALIKKGYKLDERPNFLNLIAVRENDVITNKFTDTLYCLVGGLLVSQIAWTTKPGLRGSILEPVTVEGVTGTAIMQPGQYINAFEFRDTSKEFSKYPYFRQVGPINYWRDYDKDLEIDRVQPQLKKLFGTHLHVMSQIGTFGSGLINNWSLGCNGAAEPNYKKLPQFARLHIALHGNKFNYTILEAKDF